MREIFENLLTLLDRGEDAVLVTVVCAPVGQVPAFDGRLTGRRKGDAE